MQSHVKSIRRNIILYMALPHRAACLGGLCRGNAQPTASRTMRRCTPSFLETPAFVPIPNSYPCGSFEKLQAFGLSAVAGASPAGCVAPESAQVQNPAGNGRVIHPFVWFIRGSAVSELQQLAEGDFQPH